MENTAPHKIIVFAPHPDDETLGCGGTIARRITEGSEALIIVMTDGRHAFSRILGIDFQPSPQELKIVRREEIVRAAKHLGVREKNIIFLDFEDGKLAEKNIKVEEKVTRILKKHCPSEIYFPYGNESNPDHRETNRIVKNAVKKLNFPGSAFQYSIIPRCSRLGPAVDKFLNLLKRDIVQVDISGYLSLKEAAIQEFESQISIISSRQKRPILTEVKRFLRDKERFHAYKRNENRVHEVPQGLK